MRIKKEYFYLNNGYLNIEYILSRGATFTAIVGGRGTGKTFGILKYLLESGQKFLHVRRTKVQAELISLEANNNFLKLNELTGSEIHPVKEKGEGGSQYYRFQPDEEGELVPVGDPIGKIAALSTMYNLRGISDDSSIKWIFYDEFIPLINERPIKGEFESFYQMYETFNRNRELEGEDPIRVVMAANANTINNPIFKGLGIVNRLLKAQQKKNTDYMFFPGKDLLIIFAKDSPISARKKDTALARLLEGSDIMSSYIDNEFPVDDERFIRSEPLKEYTPLAVLGAVCIYKHKSERRFYVTPHISGSPPVYPESDAVRFFRKYYILYDAFVDYKIWYSDYLTKSIFCDYIK